MLNDAICAYVLKKSGLKWHLNETNYTVQQIDRERERRKPTKFVCQTHFHIMINMRGHCYALSSFPGTLLLKGISLSHGAR